MLAAVAVGAFVFVFKADFGGAQFRLADLQRRGRHGDFRRLAAVAQVDRRAQRDVGFAVAFARQRLHQFKAHFFEAAADKIKIGT